MERESSAVQVLSLSFPNDLVVEILTRLPVKSLVRFRCVSKSWLSQISSPAFVKAHLKCAVNLKNSMYLLNHHLFCIYYYPRIHFREYSLHFMLHEIEVIDTLTLNNNNANPEIPMRMLGSCNGIVCVAIDETYLFLWNPIISKYKCLPRLHSPPGLCCYLKDGFGYEEINNDYKVVAIFYCIVACSPCEVHIYSLKTNEWKRIEDFKYGTPLDHSAKYARGKLHWLVDCDGSPEIVTLDLASERYGKLGGPNSAFSSWKYDDLCPTLGLFSDDLCLLYDDQEAKFDLWVMKEYGNKYSWASAFTLPIVGTPGSFPHMLRVRLLSDDEILLVYGCVVIIYHQKENMYRFPLMSEDSEIYQGDVLVESLISPGDGEREDEEEESEENEGSTNKKYV